MSKFIIYPAIDIRNGKCVRLYQGDYNLETVYGESPVEMAKNWLAQGAKYLHLVDLDGAKEGKPVNISIIEQIAKEVPLPIQVGGGIRTREDVDRYLSMGVQRVILGTVLLEDLELVNYVLEKYKERIVIGLDAKDGNLAVRGWLDQSDLNVKDLAKKLNKMGAKTFIYTDIGKDGTLAGPNIEKTRELAEAIEGEVIASGGVSAIEDLQALAQLSAIGITGAIVGKALYTGNIELNNANKKIGGD